MATDRSLGTLLRALQSGSNEQDVSRLLGSATTLLTLLSNPLNVTLLTSQLLSASSIWQRPDGLRTVIRILSIFNSAAIKTCQQQDNPPVLSTVSTHRTLYLEDWAIAVVKGADNRSPRWRHLCVLAGLLIGFETRGQGNISATLRSKLEIATVKAANLALRDCEAADYLAINGIGLLLSHVFDLLDPAQKLILDHDLLLPILYHAPFFAREGLHSGYFLSTIDADITQVADSKFDWSTRSSTYVQCQRMATGPLLTSLGSMARLAAFSVEHVHNVDLLSTMVSDLQAFTRSLCVQWRQNKLSEIEFTEEAVFLSNETLKATLPLLWRTLKSSMFAIVIVLRSLLGRLLRDPRMPANGAPFMAIQTLHILRNLYFISSRSGSSAFSQYTFIYLTAIDILSQYPVQAEAFLLEIRSTASKSIPQHPLDRCHDLYFLNTAEHFTTILAPELNEQLLIGAATPYLGLGSDPRLLEIFEAAHSVMLAVLAAPQNSDILTIHLRPYLEVLFQVFPQNLSPRQFQMAIKTLVRITSPPSPISEHQPYFPSTILELVRFRLQTASPTPLHADATLPGSRKETSEPQMSEQSVLMLTLIDALAYLSIDQLEDWLPIVADSLGDIRDAHQQDMCSQRLWQALSSGEMDGQRAAICLTWWGTRGGREKVFQSDDQESGPFMSGGLQETGRL